MSTCLDCLNRIVELMKSIIVLAGAAMYRIVTFMIFLSASIGPSVLVARLYNNVSGLDPMPDIVESAICMLLVSLWAEFSVGCEKRVCGDVLRDYKQKYPTTMSFGRFVVHFIFYMLAYCQLYIQFEAVHTIPAPSSSSTRVRGSNGNYYYEPTLQHRGSGSPPLPLPPRAEQDDEREAEAVRNQELHTALFLLALAYLIFVTSRTFHKDLLHAVGNLPVASFSILSNCMLRIGFAILHAIVNTLYFLPCIAIAFTARGYKTPGNTTYFQLTFTACLSGMVGALFELNRPWPQSRGRIPCLFYENNLIGKNLLGHALVVATLMGYYRPFRNPKVPESKFDSTNSDVINFCLSVAYTLLHVVKVASHGILTQANDLNDRMDQGFHDFDPPYLPNINALFEVIDDHPHNQNQSQDIGRSGGGGDDGGGDTNNSDSRGDGGMCERCTANAINNNSHGSSQPPALTSTNNNDEVRPNRPPLKKQANDSEVTRVYSERTELTTILEEGEKIFVRDLKEELSRISRNNNIMHHTEEEKQDDIDRVKVEALTTASEEQEQRQDVTSSAECSSSSASSYTTKGDASNNQNQG